MVKDTQGSLCNPLCIHGLRRGLPAPNGGRLAALAETMPARPGWKQRPAEVAAPGASQRLSGLEEMNITRIRHVSKSQKYAWPSID